jgi:type VI protein secretion system component Hcp
MSKTHDTSKLASRDRELRDDELDAVTGGAKDTASTKLMEACCPGKHIPNVVIE